VTLSEFIHSGKTKAHRFDSPAIEAGGLMDREEKSTMQFNVLFVILLLANVFIFGPRVGTDSFISQGSDATDKFVYADFEKVENGRPVSNGGGLVQIYTAQESTPAQFKGLAAASPGAPELVRLKEGDANHLATFEYSLNSPNQWANVTMEVQGHPTKDGQTVADDVTAYKSLSTQLYASGVESLRVEFISHGQGIKLDSGFPQTSIKLKPGLNTYVIAFKTLAQPSWVSEKVDTKEVLKKLTAISISAYCNQCTPQHGKVVVDNLVFQK
jgi:hypothetical protein